MKKFYWIKLKTDFFSQLNIKLLRREPDGDTLVVIYLKMMLAAANSGGVLSYGETDNFAEMLAVDLDEKQEHVEALLDFLSKKQLIAENGLSCSVKDVCVGSETSDALRKRSKRQQENVRVEVDSLPNLQEENADKVWTNSAENVDKTWTNSDASVENVLSRVRERDRDKEIRDKSTTTSSGIDAPVDNSKAVDNSKNVFELYDSEIQPLTEFIGEELRELVSEYGEKFVEYGIREAAKARVHNIRYVAACAKNEAERVASGGKSRSPTKGGVVDAAKRVKEILTRTGV